MIRVLIADDEALVREGLRLMLEVEDDVEVVGDAAGGREAVEAARRLQPDVVLMDIHMADMDGIEATRRLVQLNADIRVLILTTFDLDQYVYSGMKAGASGFLLKDVDRRHLIGGIRAVASGDTLLAPALVRRLVERFVDRPQPGLDRPPGLDELSDRELEVLRLVARGRSNAEIAAEIFLGHATVKTHVANLLRKLGVRDRVQLVVVAYETGLVEAGGAG